MEKSQNKERRYQEEETFFQNWLGEKVKLSTGQDG
jgi:hypothetical protein